MAGVQPAGAGWDMSDWEPGDIVVEGVVMALEGCGANDDEVEVVDRSGRPMRIIRVDRAGAKVRIVVSSIGPDPAAASDARA